VNWQYYKREQQWAERRQRRYTRTTRLNIMLYRWSTGGGGGARTVRHRHPSVLTGDCSSRLESTTRLGHHGIHFIDDERGRSIFGSAFSHNFFSRFLSPDTTRGHRVYHQSDTSGLTLLRSKLFLYIHWMWVNTRKHGDSPLVNKRFNIRMICSDDFPKTTQLMLLKN